MEYKEPGEKQPRAFEEKSRNSCIKEGMANKVQCPMVSEIRLAKVPEVEQPWEELGTSVRIVASHEIRSHIILYRELCRG